MLTEKQLGTARAKIIKAKLSPWLNCTGCNQEIYCTQKTHEKTGSDNTLCMFCRPLLQGGFLSAEHWMHDTQGERFNKIMKFRKSIDPTYTYGD